MKYLLVLFFAIVYEIDASCPNGTFPNVAGDKCYFIPNGTKQFILAELNCKQQNGDLASISNAFDNMALTGLQYISSKGLIHLDIAARNILLCENNVAKISDFGLCCTTDSNSTYQASLHKRLPMKWLPIEALTQRIFSEKSDVWSFGILMYEMYSLGKAPYENLDSTTVLEFLQAGNRLECPELANGEVYDIMRSCWREEPDSRPNFGALAENLRIVLEKLTENYGYLM